VPLRTYLVPGITCEHCKTAIEGHVSPLGDVEEVQVDIDAKTVTVRGDVTDEAIRHAIDQAGYDVATSPN
jgi:copper chaperone